MMVSSDCQVLSPVGTDAEGAASADPSNPPAVRAVPPLPATSEESLVKGLVRGQAWAANELYDHLYPAVSSALARVLGRQDQDFDDLLQVTFEQIIISIVDRKFSGQCKLTTWASAIASHVAIDALRGRTRSRKLFRSQGAVSSDVGPSEQDESPQRQLEARSDFEQVRRALGRIDPGKAQVITLHHVFGYDLALVAAMMGISPSACQSRLVRGRKQFLEALKQEEEKGGQS